MALSERNRREVLNFAMSLSAEDRHEVLGVLAESVGLLEGGALVGDRLVSEFSDLRRFIDRRIAELSNEVHCTIEMMDMGEQNIKSSLAEVRDQLSAIAYHNVEGARAASANTGYELEEVLQVTEAAAVQILLASEKIMQVMATADFSDTVSLQEVKDVIFQEVEGIMLACSFQDLASQRVKKALERLSDIASTLDATVKNLGGEPAESAGVEHLVTPALDQGEIDRLMGGFGAVGPAEANAPFDQSEIDHLFDEPAAPPASVSLTQEEIEALMKG